MNNKQTQNGKMLALICYEASDPEWLNDNPHGISMIEVDSIQEKEAVITKVCEIIADYKDSEENWNYQDAIEAADQWLIKQGYLVNIPAFGRIDLG